MKVVRQHTVYFSEYEIRRMAGLSEHWSLDDINRSEEKGYEIKAMFVHEVPEEEQQDKCDHG